MAQVYYRTKRIHRAESFFALPCIYLAQCHLSIEQVSMPRYICIWESRPRCSIAWTVLQWREREREKKEVVHTGSWRRSSERLDENGIKVLRSSFHLTMRFESKLQSKRARAMRNPYLLVSSPLLCTWHIFRSVTNEQKVRREKRGSKKILIQGKMILAENQKWFNSVVVVKLKLD